MPPPQPPILAAAAVAAILVAMLLRRRKEAPTTTTTTPPPQHIRPLPDFATLPRVGWRWERWKSSDENWLDLAYLVARASEAKDGHMGCCIVRDPHGREPSLVSTTINCGIYGRYRSDLHAEAAAVSDCARRGEKLEGCTLYVTRAPCPRCHCLIATAGIRRVVAPTDLETEACVVSAAAFGMEMIKLRDNEPRKAWRDGLALKYRDDDKILAARMMRKQMKKAGDFGKKAKVLSPKAPKYPPGDFSPTRSKGAPATPPRLAPAEWAAAATPVRPRAPN